MFLSNWLHIFMEFTFLQSEIQENGCSLKKLSQLVVSLMSM